MVKVLDFHLSSKIRNQIEDSNLNHFTGNLRSKRFQSIYCAKVRAEAKKSYAAISLEMLEHDLQMIYKLLDSRVVFVFSYFVDFVCNRKRRSF